MGKAVMLLVVGAMLTGATLMTRFYDGSVDRARLSAEQEREQLAQAVAQSGYTLGAHRLRQSFTPFSETGVSYGEGTYDLRAVSSASGLMELWATADVGGTAYDIRGEYARLSTPCDLLGAVFVNADIATTVQFLGEDFRVRGQDTRPPSRTQGEATVSGAGYTVSGFITEENDGLITGPLAGLGSLETTITVGNVADENYLRELLGCVLAMVDAVVEEADERYLGDRVFADRTFGTAAAPILTFVEGDATFRETTRGYGVLLVGGDLRAEDDFVWEGLVLAVGEGDATLVLEDGARVYGGLISGGLPATITTLGSLLGGGWSLADGLGSTLESLLDAGGGVVGELAGYQRPVALTLADSAGIYHSQEALGSLVGLLPTVESSSRIELLDERFGMAAAP